MDEKRRAEVVSLFDEIASKQAPARKPAKRPGKAVNPGCTIIGSTVVLCSGDGLKELLDGIRALATRLP